jgi:hypothetical protein
MTTETSNFVRVRPGPANGNGSSAGNAGETPHAQPRAGARARGGRSVSGMVAVPKERQLEPAAAALPADPESDRPDMLNRSPLPLATVWRRGSHDVAARWNKGEFAMAVGLAACLLVAEVVSAPAYALAFCSQAPHRQLWLAVAVGALVAFLVAGGEPAPVAIP